MVSATQEDICRKWLSAAFPVLRLSTSLHSFFIHRLLLNKRWVGGGENHESFFLEGLRKKNKHQISVDNQPPPAYIFFLVKVLSTGYRNTCNQQKAVFSKKSLKISFCFCINSQKRKHTTQKQIDSDYFKSTRVIISYESKCLFCKRSWMLNLQQGTVDCIQSSNQRNVVPSCGIKPFKLQMLCSIRRIFKKNWYDCKAQTQQKTLKTLFQLFFAKTLPLDCKSTMAASSKELNWLKQLPEAT